MQTRQEIQELCKENLRTCAIGQNEDQIQNGLDFYKYFFTNYPDLRVYFKGAENFTAQEVQKSERFRKQGQRILLAVHLIVNVYADDMIFRAYARETVNRHRQFKMAPELWNAFWAVFVGFLSTKTTLSEKHKQAWAALGKDFAEVAIAHLNQSH